MSAMKSFGAALAASVLLCPGLAFAATAWITVQQLDGLGTMAPRPVEYARELVMVPAGKKAVVLKSPAAASASDTIHRVAATLKRRITTGDTLYFRLSLGGGMVFAEGKTVNSIRWAYSAHPEKRGASCGGKGYHDYLTRDGRTIQTNFIAGRSGESVAVFKVITTGDPWNNEIAIDDGNGNKHIPESKDFKEDEVSSRCRIAVPPLPVTPMKIFADIVDFLAVPAGEGSYTASLSLHGDADEALAGTNKSSALDGTATIMKVVNGLDTVVKAEKQPAVAHVGTSPRPFLWFHDTSTTSTTGVKNMAVLGSAKATVAKDNLYNPANGKVATGSDLLPDGSINFSVEGDFSIGAFNLEVPASQTTPSTICPEAGTADAPTMGNLKPATAGPANMAMLKGQNAGTYHLCVQVDTMGANATPIPAGVYRATIGRTRGTGGEDTLATGVIGQIRRNGTTVKLGYLTGSEKYNQRLVILNDGATDAKYDLGSFVTEADTRAMPKAAASGTVPAGGQVVLRVADLVQFTGSRTRTGATLSIDADVDDIQVLTTQVNMLDGSTDTVVYASVDGASLN